MHRICNLLKGNKEDYYLDGLFDAYTKYKGKKYQSFKEEYLQEKAQNMQKKCNVTFTSSKIDI